MKDRTLIKTGLATGVIAAICCATPLLALVLAALGLSAWLAKADYVLIPVLVVSVGIVALGLYRRRAAAQACCQTPASKVQRYD